MVRVIKLGILINNIEEKNPIDLQPGGQRSRSQGQGQVSQLVGADTSQTVAV